MIIMRRPRPIYDVDVAGSAALVALALAAWWLVARPCAATWEEYSRTVATRTTLAGRVDADSRALQRSGQELARLEQLVSTEAGQVPPVSAFSDQLRGMSAAAQEAGLRLMNVEPQAAQPSGPYTITDIKVDGRGVSRDFLRFLDRLATENPYQSLRAFSIRRTADSLDPACSPSWTTRFYLLSGMELEGRP